MSRAIHRLCWPMADDGPLRSPLIDVFGRSSPMPLYSIAPLSSRFICNCKTALLSIHCRPSDFRILLLFVHLQSAASIDACYCWLVCKSIVDGGIIVPHHSAALQFPQPRETLFRPPLRHGCFVTCLFNPNCCLNFWPSSFDACIFGESSVDDRSWQLQLTALRLFVAELLSEPCSLSTDLTPFAQFWLPRAFIIFHFAIFVFIFYYFGFSLLLLSRFAIDSIGIFCCLGLTLHRYIISFIYCYCSYAVRSSPADSICKLMQRL
jgi:hypothetical protein